MCAGKGQLTICKPTFSEANKFSVYSASVIQDDFLWLLVWSVFGAALQVTVKVMKSIKGSVSLKMKLLSLQSNGGKSSCDL